MAVKGLFVGAICLLTLAGCQRVSQEANAVVAAPKISVSALDPDHDSKAVQAEDALSEACPALYAVKAADEIESVTHTIGEPNLDTQRTLGWSKAVTVEVALRSPTLSLPADWHASGQHCFFEVGPNGVAVEKEGCRHICDLEPSETMRRFGTL